MDSRFARSQEDTPEFRRNLSLAACQPCRKAKTGCDHATPCSRCTKRGLQHQCVYRSIEEQPAKTVDTKDIEASKNGPLEQRLKQIERSLQNLQRQLQPEVTPTNSKKRRRDAGDGTGAQNPPVNDDWNEDDIQTSDNGDPSFIGPNSETTALQEFISTREEFKEILGTLPAEPPKPSLPLPAWASASDEWQVRQSRLELGERILSNFPPKELCEKLLHVYFDIFNHIRPIVPRKWADDVLQDIFQIDSLTDDRKSPPLPNIIAKVESHSLKSTVNSVGPPSLVNWNNMGSLSAMFTIAAYVAPDSLRNGALQYGDGYTNVESIEDFTLRMKKTTSMCWELYIHTAPPDESIIIFLYLYNFMLIALGDYGSYLSYLVGCLIEFAVRIDLHRDLAKDANSSDYAERRRTEYAAIYHLDKTHATFNGRPPLMFQRFSSTSLPPTGTAENRYLRAQFLIAQAREDVLELILMSPRSPEKIADLQKTVLDRYNSITPELRYNRSDPTTAKQPSLNAQRIVLYLFSLENSFLVHSVARKKTRIISEARLLKVSTMMFGAVVRMWEDRAEFGNITFLFSWLLTSYAFAAAGIIFSGVLKLHASLGANFDILPPPLTSKSHHLKELSQFLHALSCIPSTDAHFKACQKALRIFSKVNEALKGTHFDPVVNTNSLQPEQTADISGPPSSDSYSETGLNNNLSDFGALPWLDHMWMGWGEDIVQLSEDTGITPFSVGEVGFEYWSNMI